MLKSLTIAIALLAAPVATTFTGFDSIAYAATAGGGNGGGGGGGGGSGGGAPGGGDGGQTSSAAATFVPNNRYQRYERPVGVGGAGCPTPTEGRYGPKRFIGSCGPY